MAARPALQERRRLDAEDVELIAQGAGVLGSGGGGHPYLGKLLVQSALQRDRQISLIPVEEAPPGLLLCVAQVGAPVVLAERLAQGAEALQVCATLESHLGEPAVGVVCNEIGGINSLIPLLVSAYRNIPLLDADAMGRAFPGMHQDTLSIYGGTPVPIALCDDEGNVAIVHAADMRATERMGRALTTAMGGLAYLARPVPRARGLDQVLIPGSYSRAHEIGRALKQATRSGDPRAIDLECVGGRRLFAGTIHAVERRAPGERIGGMVSIAGQGDGYRGMLRIGFQTEYLVAWYGKDLRAATPDVISVIDEDTGEPISTEALQVGLRVIVLHLAADPRLTTPQGLACVGPAAFGYGVTYGSPEWHTD